MDRDVGEATTVELTALTAPPVNVTVGWFVSTTWSGPELTVIVIVLVSAIVLMIVPVATPLASVTAGCTNVLLLPVDVSRTDCPLISAPFTSITVTEIVEVVHLLL